MEVLETYHEGIIALSACLAGEVPRYLARGLYEEAKKAAVKYRDIFGERTTFFLELQDHGIPAQKTGKPGADAHEPGVGHPAGGHQRYPLHVMPRTRRPTTFFCASRPARRWPMRTGCATRADSITVNPRRRCGRLFPYALEAIENTHMIAERCNVEIEFGVTKLPKYEVPEGYDCLELLKSALRGGL